MGKMSREKGARYEREVVNEAKGNGLPAERTAQMQTNGVAGAADLEIHDFPELHHEAKRDERKSVDAMIRQAEEDAAHLGREPVLIFRRSRQPSRAVVRLDWYLDALVALRRLRLIDARGDRRS